MNNKSDINYSSNFHDNITFFFEEKNNPDTEENFIHQIIEEINQDFNEYENENEDEEEEEEEGFYIKNFMVTMNYFIIKNIQ